MATYTVKDNQSGKTVTFNWNGIGKPTDQDMEEVFASARSVEVPKESAGPDIPEWGRENPNLYGAYGAGKAIISQAVKPTLETLGAIGGSLASPIVGTALGYGAGKKVGEIIEGQYAKLENPDIEMKSIPEEVKGSAVDVGSALALGKGMELAGRGASAAGDYLFEDLPKKLYASAVKLPLSKKWTEVLPGKEISKRGMAVEEGIRSKVPPSEYGLEKAKMLERDVLGYVDEIVQIGSKDPSKIFQTEEVLKSGLAKAYARAENSSDPAGVKAIIDDIAEKFRQHGDTITLDKANAIKRQLYDEVKWGGAETTALGGQMTTTSKKGIAHDLMVRMEEIYPELKSLNATDAARINLIEALEKSVAREGNKNVIGLGAKVLVGPKSWPLAIWEATVGHPQIKAQLAFALSKARPERWGKFQYPNLPPEYTPPPKIGEVGTGWTPKAEPVEIGRGRYPDVSGFLSSQATEGYTPYAMNAQLRPDQLAAQRALRGPTARDIRIQDIANTQTPRQLTRGEPPNVSGYMSSVEGGELAARQAPLRPDQLSMHQRGQMPTARDMAIQDIADTPTTPIIRGEPPNVSGMITRVPREEPAAMQALRGRPRTTPPQDEALKRLMGTRKMQEFYRSKGLSPFGKPIE